MTSLAFSSNSPTIAAGLSSGRVAVLRMSGIEAPAMWRRLLPAEMIERGGERVRALVAGTEE